MKKIIYTTDFSKNSVAALKYAVALGEIFNTDVIVLHIATHRELGLTKKDNEKEARIALKDKLKEFCSEHLEEDLSDLNLTVAVKVASSVTKGILDFTRDMEIKILIMGACGSGSFKDFFLGSSTKDMLELSPYPLLAVPPNYRFTELQNVVYTTDFEQEDIINLKELLSLLKPVQPKLIILHVSDQDETMTRNLLEWFKKNLAKKVEYSHIEFKIIFSDNILKSLKENIENLDADMVVMLERKPDSQKSSLLHRDLVKRMQSCIEVPLLSFNEKF
ncbi:universal stress protein [Salegentibacter sediminis]|uniref:universal stress protein n=1 Tax=Salegentibacter sediminis TaxID=1930251 RepID=UPI0009BD6FAD|nr:universal stress protein [Salegentibacter sediminis]